MKILSDAGMVTTALGAICGIAELRAAEGQPDQALELMGLVLSDPVAAQNPDLQPIIQTVLAALGDELPPDVVTAGLERGKGLDLDRVIADLLDTGDTMPGCHDAGQASVESLSGREFDVLRLIAEGLSNAEIAQKLFLSKGTVKVHTRHIYEKLGVNRRTQAVATAQRRNLI